MIFLLALIPDPERRMSFEQFYRDHYRACLSHALRYTNGNMVYAEDAVHNAFAKIITKYPHYLDDSCKKLKTLCVTIMKRAAIDVMRKEGARGHEELDEEVIDSRSAEMSLSEVFESREGYDGIKKCIKELDIKYREVFALRYQCDMANKEIADILGLTENNVAMRLFRAKKQLSELLKKEGIVNDRLNKN